jgi:hypothetical protein
MDQTEAAAPASPLPSAALSGAAAPRLSGQPVYADHSTQSTVARVELYEVSQDVEKDALIIDPKAGEFPPLSVRTMALENLRLTVYDQDFAPVYVSSTPSSGTPTTQVLWKGQDASGNELPAGRYTASLSSSLETVVKEVVLR